MTQRCPVYDTMISGGLCGDVWCSIQWCPICDILMSLAWYSYVQCVIQWWRGVSCIILWWLSMIQWWVVYDTVMFWCMIQVYGASCMKLDTPVCRTTATLPILDERSYFISWRRGGSAGITGTLSYTRHHCIIHRTGASGCWIPPSRARI